MDGGLPAAALNWFPTHPRHAPRGGLRKNWAAGPRALDDGSFRSRPLHHRYDCPGPEESPSLDSRHRPRAKGGRSPRYLPVPKPALAMRSCRLAQFVYLWLVERTLCGSDLPWVEYLLSRTSASLLVGFLCASQPNSNMLLLLTVSWVHLSTGSPQASFATSMTTKTSLYVSPRFLLSLHSRFLYSGFCETSSFGCLRHQNTCPRLNSSF